MNLTSQVPSLDLCKRLKELGVAKDALFSWCKRKSDHSEWLLRPTSGIDTESYDSVLAPTVAELGEMFPTRVRFKPEDNKHLFQTWNSSAGWGCNYWNDQGGDKPEFYFEESIFGDTEADARARMLIHLIENRLINPTPPSAPAP